MTPSKRYLPIPCIFCFLAGQRQGKFRIPLKQGTYCMKLPREGNEIKYILSRRVVAAQQQHAAAAAGRERAIIRHPNNPGLDEPSQRL